MGPDNSLSEALQRRAARSMEREQMAHQADMQDSALASQEQGQQLQAQTQQGIAGGAQAGDSMRQAQMIAAQKEAADMAHQRLEQDTAGDEQFKLKVGDIAAGRAKEAAQTEHYNNLDTEGLRQGGMMDRDAQREKLDEDFALFLSKHNTTKNGPVRPVGSRAGTMTPDMREEALRRKENKDLGSQNATLTKNVMTRRSPDIERNRRKIEENDAWIAEHSGARGTGMQRRPAPAPSPGRSPPSADTDWSP